MLRNLLQAKQAKNEELVNNINDAFIELRNAIITKEIPEKESPNKILDIVEKIFNFHKQQKVGGIKILTPKKIVQRILIALAQVKVGKTSEILLKKIKQIMCSLYQAKKGY